MRPQVENRPPNRANSTAGFFFFKLNVVASVFFFGNDFH
jgi:hypothetical protein